MIARKARWESNKRADGRILEQGRKVECRALRCRRYFVLTKEDGQARTECELRRSFQSQLKITRRAARVWSGDPKLKPVISKSRHTDLAEARPKLQSMEESEDIDSELLHYVLEMSAGDCGGQLVPCGDSLELASDENVKILTAIDNGDTYSLRELSECTAAFGEVDGEGWLPLHRAAVQPVKEVLETVIVASYTLTLEEKTLDGETAMTLAIQAGWVENVKVLLDQGASPNTTNDKNESPLLLAVRTRSYEMVSTLVMGGAFVEQTCLKKWSALHEAAKVGSGDIMMLLLRNGGKVTVKDGHGVTPLGVAAEHANAEVLEILIKNGADVNAQASNGDSALYDAAGSGNPDCIDLLLERGADPNVHSLCAQLPIHRAAYEGHYLALRRFIPITTERAIRLSGQSPVHSAADGGHPQCLELLIKSGFNVNAILEKHISENYADMRKSALYFAVSNGDVTCTEMLLNAGANPDADPLRCLLVAVRAGRYEIVRLLLAKQADVNCYFTAVSDTVFPTALQYCLRDEMMMRLLLNNGYDAESCFRCHHNDALASCYTGRDDLCGVQNQREKILFCDFISLSWLMHLAGCTVRILLDYVGRVTICSNLKAVLKKQRQWPEICQILGNPRQLKHLCRLVIRTRITARRLSKMDSAPFPPRVKDYLLFKEYDLYHSIMGLTK